MVVIRCRLLGTPASRANGSGSWIITINVFLDWVFDHSYAGVAMCHRHDDPGLVCISVERIVEQQRVLYEDCFSAINARVSRRSMSSSDRRLLFLQTRSVMAGGVAGNVGCLSSAENPIQTVPRWLVQDYSCCAVARTPGSDIVATSVYCSPMMLP